MKKLIISREMKKLIISQVVVSVFVLAGFFVGLNMTGDFIVAAVIAITVAAFVGSFSDTTLHTFTALVAVVSVFLATIVALVAFVTTTAITVLIIILIAFGIATVIAVVATAGKLGIRKITAVIAYLVQFALILIPLLVSLHYYPVEQVEAEVTGTVEQSMIVQDDVAIVRRIHLQGIGHCDLLDCDDDGDLDAVLFYSDSSFHRPYTYACVREGYENNRVFTHAFEYSRVPDMFEIGSEQRDWWLHVQEIFIHMRYLKYGY